MARELRELLSMVSTPRKRGSRAASGKRISGKGIARAIDATAVTVRYGPNANRSAVPSSCETVVREIVARAGGTKCTITSTLRTPADQARAMYNNLESLGVAKQRDLYGDAGDKVIDVYVAAKAAGKSADRIKADMIAKINELGPSHVSKHCVADGSRLCIVDIDPGSIVNHESFTEEVRKDPRVDKFIPPPLDPAFHLQIPVRS